MTRIKLENGRIINFDGTPTKQDIEEAVASIGGVQTKKESTGLEGFAKGVAQEELRLGFGLGKLGTKIGRILLPKFAEPKETIYEKEEPKILEAKTPSQKLGQFVAGVAEFAIPATKVEKLAKGLSFIPKLFTRAATSGAVAATREGEIGKEAGIAAGTEVALPVAGKVLKPAANIIRRLFKGVGSGISGVSTDVIDTIVENPQKAKEIIKRIEQGGGDKILEENAKTIVNGIAKVRQDARKAFGQGLEQLKKEDIKPTQFRKSIQPTLEKFGSVIEDGQRTLKNIEFTEQKNVKKASDLIDELSKVELDGVSVRKLFNKIEDSKFKTATTDERLSFNAFINELSKSVKDSISKSTDKLDEINKAFSEDIQLVESIERIFSKVNFKNANEVDKVAKKLDGLFSQKGLDPARFNEFLTKIGIAPEDLRTSEAVRQISEKTAGANRPGASVSELIQSVSGAIVTPQAVRDISVATGLTEQAVGELMEKLAPTARGTLIQSLLESR